MHGAITYRTIQDLRYELMRHLKLPPDDEETPYDPT